MGNDLDKLRAEFPASAIKQRAGGGNRALSYVEGHTVMRRLNEACDSWDFAIVREWQDGNLLKAHVRLTIPGLGSREHVGVQVVNDRPGTEDVQAKGHITDGLKKAATLFGVGLELYGPDYEAGEIAAPQRQPAPRRGPEIAPQQATRPVTGSEEASDAQIRMLMGLAAKSVGSSDANAFVHGQAKARFGVESLHELSKRGASQLIEMFQKQDFVDAVPVRQPRIDPVEQQQGVLSDMPAEPSWLADAPQYT